MVDPRTTLRNSSRVEGTPRGTALWLQAQMALSSGETARVSPPWGEAWSRFAKFVVEARLSHSWLRHACRRTVNLRLAAVAPRTRRCHPHLQAYTAGRIDFSQPRYDQSTYWGRVRHFFEITDPRTILSSDLGNTRLQILSLLPSSSTSLTFNPPPKVFSQRCPISSCPPN